MEKVMVALNDLHNVQTTFLKKWRGIYSVLKQQNQLLLQQVDYQQEKIIELEQKLRETVGKNESCENAARPQVKYPQRY